VDRSQKEEMVVQLKQLFQEQTLVVVTHYSGLTVADLTEFRGKMREAGAGYKVTKNRLSRLALDDMDFKELGELFMGPIGLAYSEDPVAAAKVTVEFAKGNENLVVLGGVFNGQIMDIAAVNSLAKLSTAATSSICPLKTPPRTTRFLFFLANSTVTLAAATGSSE